MTPWACHAGFKQAIRYRIVVQIAGGHGTAQEDGAEKTFSQSQFQRPSTMWRDAALHAFDEFYSFNGCGLVVELVV